MKAIRCKPGEMIQIVHAWNGVTVFGPIRFREFNDGKKITIRATQEAAWTITARPPRAKASKKKGRKAK